MREMDVPRFTVIVPTYNRANMLGETVRSVLAQTYENFELVIMDDCSEDNTEHLVRSFDDRRIRYFCQTCRQGVAGNWASGLNEARGTFISFLMDDDCYREDFLQNRTFVLEREARASAVFSACQIMDVDGKVNGAERGNRRMTSAPTYSHLSKQQVLRAAVGNRWGIGSTVYRRDVANRFFATNYPLCPDLYLNVQIALYSNDPVLCLEDTTDLLARHHGGRVSAIRRREVQEEVAEMFGMFLKRPLEKEEDRIIRSALSHWNATRAMFYGREDAMGKALRCAGQAVVTDLSNKWAWKRLMRIALDAAIGR